MKKLVRNAAKCRHCGDVIESRSVHDFVRCSCGSIFVDGGLDYARGGGNPQDWEPLYEFDESKPQSYLVTGAVQFCIDVEADSEYDALEKVRTMHRNMDSRYVEEVTAVMPFLYGAYDNEE